MWIAHVSDHHACTFGGGVAHICIILRYGMRDSSCGSRRHPVEHLFDTSANVREMGLILHRGKSGVATYAADLSMCFLPRVGEDNNGLGKCVKGIGRSIRASLQKRSRQVGRLVVAKALLLLNFCNISTERIIHCAVQHTLLCIKPVAEIE